jgi:murein L,D-transpeptidase YafK
MSAFLKNLSLFLIFFTYYNSQLLAQNTDKIDQIKIIKSERKLFTYSKGKILKTYKIALGKNPIGQKLKEGDGRTPEGVYEIIAKNPKSAYHLSLKISYPNSKQIEEAKKLSINPGGDIMIHGIRNGFGFVGKHHSLFDWTKGCIAVSNKEIEEIYNLVSIGTKVEILP